MTIQTRTVDYECGGQSFEAFMAWDDMNTDPMPAVLVAHAFRGREEFECNKAIKLAELGYVGFAMDVYGKGVRAETKEQAYDLMGALTADRVELQNRLASSVGAAQQQAEVNEQELAAMGFCFGGLCVLDMARAGLPVKGVVSFHGMFTPLGNTEGNTINSKVLVEHGWDDPMATPDAVLGFAQEMSSAGADWQLHAHGNTAHSFTNPAANDAAAGTIYNEAADRRSWESLTSFLAELFG